MNDKDEDIESTKINYEQQLAAMTEHMVKLSDLTSSYEAELETLKSFKVRCGKCKTWNSIAWLLNEGQNGQICSHGNHPSSFNFA